jgi:hypothetical protein
MTALAATALALAFLGLVLRPALQGRPDWLPLSDSTTDLETFTRSASRISGVWHAGKQNDPMGIMIGSSSIQCSVDPGLLGDELRGSAWPTDWLVLYGGGVNAGDAADLARLALDGGLHPQYVVFSLNVGSVARSEGVLSDPIEPSFETMLHYLAERSILLARKELDKTILVPWNRNFPNRTRINHWVRLGVFREKVRMMTALGFHFDEMFAPARDPWRVSVDWMIGDHVPPSVIELQMAGWRGKGWFEPSSYADKPGTLRALIEITRELTNQGIHVWFVLVPEKSTLREAMPAEAKQSLQEALDHEFGGHAPSILDCRDALPDDLFFDVAHVNREGKKVFTHYLATKLREQSKP